MNFRSNLPPQGLVGASPAATEALAASGAATAGHRTVVAQPLDAPSSFGASTGALANFGATFAGKGVVVPSTLGDQGRFSANLSGNVIVHEVGSFTSMMTFAT